MRTIDTSTAVDGGPVRLGESQVKPSFVNSIRVSSSSPGYVTLQMRAEDKHITTTLPFDVVHQLINAMSQALVGFGPQTGGEVFAKDDGNE